MSHGVDQPSRRAVWRRRFASIEAAAVTGVVFALLYGASLWLIQLALPDWDATADQIAAETARTDVRNAMTTAYALAPFAAIAFVWFIAVIRRRIPSEDRFVSTVFTGAGTVFVVVYLVAISVVAAPFYVEAYQDIDFLQPETLVVLRSIAYGLLFVVGTRLQALVILSATAVGRQYRVWPRWLVFFGYAISAFHIVNLTLFEPLLLTFPVWVIALSITLLVRRRSVPSVDAT